MGPILFYLAIVVIVTLTLYIFSVFVITDRFPTIRDKHICLL
jgi:hypothetical protein